MKKILILTLILGTVAAGIWWLWQRQVVTTPSDRLQVVATFYPIAYFAQQVGGEHIQLTTIIPNGVEPHDFVPTPQDILKITTADVVIYNGGGLDNWAVNALQNNGNVQDGRMQPIEVSALSDENDPHVWLDPVLMQTYVDELTTRFSTLDPVHAVDYQSNANRLVSQLNDLDTQYQTGLSQCEIRQAIVAHDAFGYLGRRYRIDFLSIVGLSPNETPSAQTIAELSNLAREHNIHYIFFEELTNPKLSEVLANEVGAETLVLSPLEGLSEEDQATGADYFTLMQQNLQNLRLAMRCQ